MVLEPILKNIRRPKDSRYPFSELLKKSLLNILSALEHGGRSAATVAMACASAGIIVGVVTLTGLGFKIAASAIALSHGYLPIILLLTMVVSLVLGMGVPTTANYIITSTIAAPAIITFVAKGYGMSVIDFLEAYPELVLPAHMFVFYFGVAADLTPPVALAAYAGSAIAGSDPWKTGINAVKIGIGKYLVPYLFIFTPALLLIGIKTPADILNLLLIVISVMLGIMAINAGTIGCVLRPISRTLRIISLGAGALLLIPDSMLKIVGFVIFAGIFLKQYYSLHDEVN
jgi:TRAP transporter 4TM/12TM fusion protein